jgi:hypothetical protein
MPLILSFLLFCVRFVKFQIAPVTRHASNLKLQDTRQNSTHDATSDNQWHWLLHLYAVNLRFKVTKICCGVVSGLGKNSEVPEIIWFLFQKSYSYL